MSALAEQPATVDKTDRGFTPEQMTAIIAGAVTIVTTVYEILKVGHQVLCLFKK